MTVVDFKTKFTEFTEVDNAKIELFLLEAETLFSENIGAKYETLVSLHVAHELALDSQNKPFIGDVVSRSIEGGSITYATIRHDSNSLYYSSSRYGKKLLAILTNSRKFAGSVCD